MTTRPMDDYDADSLAAHLFTVHGHEGGFEGASLEALRLRHARAHMQGAERASHIHPGAEGESTQSRRERLAALRQKVEPPGGRPETLGGPATPGREWHEDFLDPMPMSRHSTPIDRIGSARFVPDQNLLLSADPDFLLSEEARGMRLQLEAKVLRSKQVEEVRWSHSTKHPEGVWAAVVVYWLLPVFEWLRDGMVRRDSWVYSQRWDEQSRRQHLVLRLLNWADRHWTRDTETFSRDVPVRWCPHVPIPDGRGHRTHLEWVTHGEPDSIRECKQVLRDVLAYGEHPGDTVEEAYERMQRRARGHLNNLDYLWGP